MSQRRIGRYLLEEQVECIGGYENYKARVEGGPHLFFRVHLFTRGALSDEALKSLSHLCDRLVVWRHRHAVSVVDHGFFQGGYFVVVRDFPTTLAEQLRARSLTPPQAFRWARQVADALGEAARFGLHHGHLTPESIFLDSGGQARVAGLGLSAYQWLAAGNGASGGDHIAEPLSPPDSSEHFLAALADRRAIISILLLMLFKEGQGSARGELAERIFQELESDGGSLNILFTEDVDRAKALYRHSLPAGSFLRLPIPLPSRQRNLSAAEPRPVPSEDASIAAGTRWAFSRWALTLALAGLSVALVLGLGYLLLNPFWLTAFVRPPVSLPETGGPVDVVEEAVGGSWIRPSGFLLRLPLQAGIAIQPQDELYTDPLARVRFRLGQATTVTLYGDSVVSVLSLGSTLDPATWLRLSRGVMVVTFESQPPVRQVLVLLPWGTASVNASTMGLRVDPEAGTLGVACFEGDCSVNLGDSQRTVPPGSQLTYTSGSDSTSSEFLSLRDAQAWAEFNSRPTETPSPSSLPSDTAAVTPSDTPAPTLTLTPEPTLAFVPPIFLPPSTEPPPPPLPTDPPATDTATEPPLPTDPPPTDTATEPPSPTPPADTHTPAPTRTRKPTRTSEPPTPEPPTPTPTPQHPTKTPKPPKPTKTEEPTSPPPTVPLPTLLPTGLTLPPSEGPKATEEPPTPT